MEGEAQCHRIAPCPDQTRMTSARSTPKPHFFEMIVDRPFFFAILDDHSHMILFMGTVNDPHRF